jgi:hypothetical protein
MVITGGDWPMSSSVVLVALGELVYANTSIHLLGRQQHWGRDVGEVMRLIIWLGVVLNKNDLPITWLTLK